VCHRGPRYTLAAAFFEMQIINRDGG